MSVGERNFFSVKISKFFPTDLAKKLYQDRLTVHRVIDPDNKMEKIVMADEVETNAKEICATAVTQWRVLLLFVNLTIGGPVVLGEMLVPEGETNSFSKKLAKKLATWSKILDRVYSPTYGNNSEQGKQLSQTFASNMRAEIDRVGQLRISDNLVINKCGSRYILEKENQQN